MKTLTITLLSAAAVSCSTQQQPHVHQPVAPKGSEVDNWTQDVTREWYYNKELAKYGIYGSATGYQGSPFAPR